LEDVTPCYQENKDLPFLAREVMKNDSSPGKSGEPKAGVILPWKNEESIA
jgi:hypothetical protein